MSAFLIGAESYGPVFPCRFLQEVRRSALGACFWHRLLPGNKIAGRVLVATVEHPPFPGPFLYNISFAALGTGNTDRH